MNLAIMLWQETVPLREKFQFMDLPPAWLVFLVLLPGLFFFAYYSYRREKLGSNQRKILITLRFLALTLLVFILFRPVMETFQVMVQKSKLIMLFDDSASMQRHDSYPQPSLNAAIHEAARLEAQENVGDYSRIELAARTLDQKILDDLANRYELHLYRFAEEITPIQQPDEVLGRGDRTRIGEALHEALDQHRGQFVQGIVLVSDGRSNEGRAPRSGAQRASGLGIPIYTVGVGDATQPKNIALSIVEAPTVALQGDEITLTARIQSSGYQNHNVQMVLENQETRAVLAEESVAIEDGDGKLTALTFRPNEAGEYRLTLSAPPLPEETLADDNAVSFTLRVRPEKIRVLYVEGRPRWEYRYLKEILRRTDRNIVLQVFLVSADREFPQESTRGVPPLSELPTKVEDLLANYDVVILGDVDPYSLAPTTELCDEFMASIKAFVEKGGGFLMIAGEFDAPRSYEGTPIEELLPVILGKGEEDTVLFGDSIAPFNPILENPARPHEITRLHTDTTINRTLWESDKEGLAGWYWYYPVRKAKPAAEVLFRHPRNKNRYGNHVLAAVTYYPEGRTMFLGVDEIWRWRFLYSDTYTERFWRNSVRYLALNRLRGEDRRFRLATEKSVYELNERSILEARVLDEDFSPAKQPVQTVFLLFPDGHQEKLQLELVPGQAGIYRSSILLGTPGHYQAKMTANNEPDDKSVASVDFEAVIPSRELSNPSLDAETLEEIAKISGGKYLSLADMNQLAAYFKKGGEIEIPVLPPERKDLWDSPWVLGLLILILATEWVLRKKSLLI